jgi:flagellar biosynthesis regulator FlbT
MNSEITLTEDEKLFVQCAVIFYDHKDLLDGLSACLKSGRIIFNETNGLLVRGLLFSAIQLYLDCERRTQSNRSLLRTELVCGEAVKLKIWPLVKTVRPNGSIKQEANLKLAWTSTA